MKKHNVNFCHTSYKIINEQDKLLGSQIAKPYISYFDLLRSCDIGLSTVLVKKKILKKKKFYLQRKKNIFSVRFAFKFKNIKIFF